MANYRVTDTELSGIASAIRLKGGTSEPLVFPSGFVSAISAIEKQGTYVSKVITENGEYDPASDNADAFSHVTVSVPSGSTPILVSKNITENGTYNPESDNADGFSQVVVSISGGGGKLSDLLDGTITSIDDAQVLSLRSYALQGCKDLTSVNFSNCKSIGTNGFALCSSLDTVNVSKCEMVSNYAFSGCSGLQSIDLPSCKSVGNGAFSMCTKLQNVNIPTCEIIYDGAFYQCASLNSIFLSNCYSIGSSAFQRCYRLLSVYLLGSSVASIKAAVFTSTPISGYTAQTGGVVGSIFVPSSLYSAYISAQNWSAFANRITSYVEE